MSSQGSQQASVQARIFFTTQAGSCGHSASGAAASTRESEVASPSAPLSSQQKPPSRSLRSARRQLDPRGIDAQRSSRSRLLRVRLTEDEAEQAARRAKARGLSLSDFVRRAVLRGTGARVPTRRCTVSAEEAATIRQLSHIAAGIRKLSAIAVVQRTVDEGELRLFLDQLRTVISGFKR
jgi:uncharacterized protein (DUF1778 family)